MTDVCIIGSGFAGSTVAMVLAQAGARVTILEAGAPHGAPEPDRLRVRFRNTGPLTYLLNGRLFRNVGGTSEHWFGNTPRPLPDDLRLSSAHGFGADWPFDYAELEPNLAEAERILGVAGTADDPLAPPRQESYPLPALPLSLADRILRDRLAPHGIAVASAPQARATQPYRGRPACARFGRCLDCPIQARPGPSSTTLRDALATGRVTLRSEAFVTHLEGDGQRIRRAVWCDASGTTFAERADVFVVAAHVPDSVRLLLFSTSAEWPDGIGNREDVVGRYFMDHPRHAVMGSLSERTWPNRVFFQTGCISHWRNRPERAERGAFLLELQNHIPDAAPANVARATARWGLPLKAHIREVWGHEVLLNAQIEMLPLRENRVQLDPARRDEFGVPWASFDVRLGAYGQAGLQSAIAALDEIMTHVSARNVKHLAMLPQTIDSCYHPAGGLRMGTDPKTSVTDAWGRVHGTRNLFVSGSGLYPTIGTANPTLTLVALALRVSHGIREHGTRGEL